MTILTDSVMPTQLQLSTETISVSSVAWATTFGLDLYTTKDWSRLILQPSRQKSFLKLSLSTRQNLSASAKENLLGSEGVRSSIRSGFSWLRRTKSLFSACTPNLNDPSRSWTTQFLTLTLKPKERATSRERTFEAAFNLTKVGNLTKPQKYIPMSRKPPAKKRSLTYLSSLIGCHRTSSSFRVENLQTRHSIKRMWKNRMAPAWPIRQKRKQLVRFSSEFSVFQRLWKRLTAKARPWQALREAQKRKQLQLLKGLSQALKSKPAHKSRIKHKKRAKLC